MKAKMLNILDSVLTSLASTGSENTPNLSFLNSNKGIKENMHFQQKVKNDIGIRWD